MAPNDLANPYKRIAVKETEEWTCIVNRLQSISMTISSEGTRVAAKNHNTQNMASFPMKLRLLRLLVLLLTTTYKDENNNNRATRIVLSLVCTTPLHNGWFLLSFQ